MPLIIYGLLTLTLSIQGTAGNTANLRINEIYFAPPENELEFIEVLNISSSTLNICSYTFADARNVEHIICEGTIVVPPMGLIILARDGEALERIFQGTTPITPPTWPALNNSGDTVQLYQNGQVVESVSYLSNWGRRDVSLERKDPAGPSDRQLNWGPSMSVAGATPGAKNSIFAPDLTPPSPVLAEVQNTTQIFVAWDEFIDTSVIEPSNFRVFQMQPRSISILTDSTILLSFPGEVNGTQLLARNISDLANNRLLNESIPLSYVPAENDLSITEIMYDPLDDDFDNMANQPEYIELYNASGKYLSLRSITLAGEKDEMNNARIITPNTDYQVLPPSSYALIYAAPSDASSPDLLQNPFPAISFYLPSISFLSVDRSTLSFSNSGDFVCISSTLKECLTSFTYSPSWHHPTLASTKGISLERRSLSAPVEQSSNWSSSVDRSGGTPGWRNSILSSSPQVEENNFITLSPEVFSPDGDGINDALTIALHPPFSPASIRVRIFDTYGRKVRSIVPQDLVGPETSYVWDGLDDAGNPLETGIYIFLVEMLDITSGSAMTIKKTAVLARLNK